MNFKQGIVITVIILFATIYLVYPMIVSVSQMTGDTERHLSAYETKYNDVSILREKIESSKIEVPDIRGKTSTEGGEKVTASYKVNCLISNPSVLLDMVDPASTVYIVTGVERKYDSSEIDALLKFVLRGGKLIICDDKGYANDLADHFDVTFFQGKLLDERYDEQLRNKNFTYTYVKLGTDYFTGPWSLGKPGGDGIFDQDYDGDGRIDEDPIDRTDNDNDDQVLSHNNKDDDWDGTIDEPREGYDEDPLDDDLDGQKDEEIYDGIDNDGDGLIDEDTRAFKVVMHNATGLMTSSESTKYIDNWTKVINGVECTLTRIVLAQGSNASFVDMDGDGKITIPQPGEDINKLADARGPITTILEIIVEPKESMGTVPGRVIFISDTDIFTNDLVSMPELNEDREPILVDNQTVKLRYDNLAFGFALIVHLLPHGGIVVFDESMHAQEPMLVPLAGTLWTLAVVTTNPLCATTLIIVIVLLAFISYVVTQGRQSWIHLFNIDKPFLRDTWPTTSDLKRIRLRHLVLEKARIRAGMSPEEFATLSQGEINKLIGDPQLIELVTSERQYTDKEIMQLSLKLKAIKGRGD